jgi:hypothetical protein
VALGAPRRRAEDDALRLIALLALTAAFAAAPADAKPPLLSHPANCDTVVHESAHVRAVCARGTMSAAPPASWARSGRSGPETEDAWLVAGGAAVAVLAIAGATLAAAHRHGVHRSRPAPQG